MIGVDTNVLLRLFVIDDVAQSERARTFFEQRPGSDPVYVNLLVIAEFVWVLASRYGYSNTQITGALLALLGNAGFVVQREDLLVAAVEQAMSSGAGIADLLIVSLNADAGCRSTATFDRHAADRITGMELLK